MLSDFFRPLAIQRHMALKLRQCPDYPEPLPGTQSTPDLFDYFPGSVATEASVLHLEVIVADSFGKIERVWDEVRY